MRFSLWVLLFAVVRASLVLDESFGDDGRLVFSGKRAVGFVVRSNRSNVAVALDGSRSVWLPVSGGDSGLHEEEEEEEEEEKGGGPFGCQSGTFAVETGVGKTVVRRTSDGATVFGQVEEEDGFGCAFVEEDRFVVVGDRDGRAVAEERWHDEEGRWANRSVVLAGGQGVVPRAAARMSGGRLVVAGLKQGEGGAAAIFRWSVSDFLLEGKWNISGSLMADIFDCAVWTVDDSVVLVGQARTGGGFVAHGTNFFVSNAVMAFKSVALLPDGAAVVLGERMNHMVLVMVRANQLVSTVTMPFGATTDVVTASKIVLDAGLFVYAVGTVRYDNRSDEGIVLRALVTPLSYSRCTVGPNCWCSGVDCVAQGLVAEQIGKSLQLGARRMHAQMAVDLLRSSRTEQEAPDGMLTSVTSVSLDGHLHVSLPMEGRFVVVRAPLVTGRYNTLSINVTGGPALEECQEYEATQVVRTNEVLISVSRIQIAQCTSAPESAGMPKGVVAAFIILAMFFSTVVAATVAQIVWKRRMEGGRTIKSTKSRSVAQSAREHTKSLSVPLVANEV